MKYLQKLGKAIMLPVAVLPVAAIMMGIGYAMCPATMQGGDVTGIIQIIGFALVKIGSAVIDKLPCCLQSVWQSVYQRTSTVRQVLQVWLHS